MEPISTTTVAATTAVATTSGTAATVAGGSSSAIASTAANVKMEVIRKLAIAAARISIKESEIIDEFAAPIYSGLSLAGNSLSPGSSNVHSRGGAGEPESSGHITSPAGEYTDIIATGAVVPEPPGSFIPEKPPAIHDDKPTFIVKGKPQDFLTPGQAARLPSSENIKHYTAGRVGFAVNMGDLLTDNKSDAVDNIANELKRINAPSVSEQLASGTEQIITDTEVLEKRIVPGYAPNSTAVVILLREKVVESKYFSYGHLSDTISAVRRGEIPSLNQCFLAVLDLADAATFGLLKPYLLKYKLSNPNYKLKQISYDVSRKMLDDVGTVNKQSGPVNRFVEDQPFYKPDKVTETTNHLDVQQTLRNNIVVVNTKIVESTIFDKAQLDLIASMPKKFQDVFYKPLEYVRLENVLSPVEIASVEKSAMSWIKEDIITSECKYTTKEEFFRYWGDMKKMLGNKISSSDRDEKVFVKTNYREYLSINEAIDVTAMESVANAALKLNSAGVQKISELLGQSVLVASNRVEADKPEFREGWINYVPLGSFVNIGTKKGLEVEVTASDYFWAGVDTVGVGIGVFTLGAGIGMSTIAKTTLSTGGKVVARESSKVIIKQTGKAIISKTGNPAARTVLQKTGETAFASRIAVKKTIEQAAITGFKNNHSYVKNGFTYVTDSKGRVIKASGKLKFEAAERMQSSQDVARKWGRPGDEGGHLVGAQFGGPGELYNHVPQGMRVNRVLVKRVENEMARFVKQGKTVDYTVKVGYPLNPPGTLRPDRFQVEYVIDGIKRIRRVKNV